MGKNKVKVWFDEEENILYISLRKGEAIDSEEKEEVKIEYDKEGKIIGIEILNVSEKLIKPLAKKIASINNLLYTK